MADTRGLTIASIVVCIVSAMLAVASLIMAQEVPPKGYLVGKSTPYDRRILELDKAAIEAAYSDQVKHLFSVWMKDNTGQPKRATTGIQQARRAYILSMMEIEKRMAELPP